MNINHNEVLNRPIGPTKGWAYYEGILEPKKEKKEVKMAPVLMPDWAKNDKHLCRWVGIYNDKIEVYERTENKAGRKYWKRLTKNLPSWAIPEVTRLLRNWKMA